MNYSTTLSCTSANVRELYKILVIILVLSMIIPPITLPNAKAYSDHPNLFVSAENSLFNNYFYGPTVVEVIVSEPNNQLDQALGEPHVTVDGKNLRMVQGTDGNWHAFFANADKAQQADQAAIGTP